MLSTHDILEKAHTIAVTHPELGKKELPDFIDGYPQEVWAELMVRAYEQMREEELPYDRIADFTMPEEEQELANDQALERLEQHIYVYLADNC